MSGVEEFRVKRRILAHDDGIKICQCRQSASRLLEPAVLLPGQADMAHLRHDLAAALPGDVLGLAGHDLVTSALSLAHHGKGGVFVDDKGFQRIGDKQYLHGDNSIARYGHHAQPGITPQSGSR